MKTIINIEYQIGTKEFVADGMRYISSYPNGYNIPVRVVKHCEDCHIEIGGFFGNGVYRYQGGNKCYECGENSDILAQVCIKQTGVTPSEYQSRYKVAWNV